MKQLTIIKNKSWLQKTRVNLSSILTAKNRFFIPVLLFWGLLSSPESFAEKLYTQYSVSTLGSPKYPNNFTHTDYVNPNAPKGGKIILETLGSFDSLNLYGQRGIAAKKLDYLNDSLYKTSFDEAGLGVYYPLIAEYFCHNADFTYLEIHINPKARFQDQTPITAEDVAFSFNKFMTQGIYQYRKYFAGVTVDVVSPLVVVFKLPEPNQQQAFGLLNTTILPKHFWQHHDLSEPLAIAPMGSGPYQIANFHFGQFIEYQRVKNYWAADLPINKGLYNFDKIRFDYYLDGNVSLEAFKAGAFDVRDELFPKNWFSQYKGPQFNPHGIIKQDIQNHQAKETRWIALNYERYPLNQLFFRKALTLAFDFEWINQHYFYGAYKRSSSYFQDVKYQAKGLPTQDELTWLLPYKKQLPTDVFGPAYQPPVSDGSGYNRKNLQKATQLLSDGGYTIKNQQLIDPKTNRPVQLELMVYQNAYNQYIPLFQKNLAHLGIKLNVRRVDAIQFSNRARKTDYDMRFAVYSPFNYPNPNLKIVWGSQYKDSAYNATNYTSPIVDDLLLQIEKHQSDQHALVSLGRALDRILTQQYLMIPLWYKHYDYLAYWNKFGHPEKRPDMGVSIDTWWALPDNKHSVANTQEASR